MVERESGKTFQKFSPRDLLRRFISRRYFDPSNGDREIVIKHLSRLDSIGGSVIFPPTRRVVLALEACKAPFTEVAGKHSVGGVDIVKRAVGDVAAAVIYSRQEDLNGFAVTPEVKRKIEVLGRVEERLKRERLIRESPQMVTALQEVPHVRDLIDCFLEFGTVRYLLEDLKIPYTSNQVRSIRRFFAGFNQGLQELAQRYLFATWLKSKGVFECYNSDKLICQAAVFLFSNNYPSYPKTEFRRINSIKMFLREMMRLEFDDVVARKRGLKGEETELFPTKDGIPAKDRYDIDMVKAYEAFENKGYCPVSLRFFAMRVVNEESQERRLAFIRGQKGEVYSNKCRSVINWTGIKFLENVLSSIMTSRARKPNFDLFFKDTSKILKEAKSQTLLASK